MKQLLIIMLTMFSLNFANAQSHNPGPNSNCKLNKNYRPNIEKISCPACDLNDKKEKVAIVAEDKRRSDIIVAKAKVEKEALDKAYKDKLALDAKNTESAGKVVIDVPKVKTGTAINNRKISGNPILVSKKDNSKSVLYSKMERINEQVWALIFNDKGDTIIKSKDFSVQSLDWNNKLNYLNYVKKSPPSNVFLASFHPTINIYNSKGEKLLNEDNIKKVFYCGDDFYLYVIDEKYENDFHSRFFSGDKIILFDLKLNKKYIYEGVDDNVNCFLYKVAQITPKSDLISSEYLFGFFIEKCTHKVLDNSGFTKVVKAHHIGIGLDRKPVEIGTTQLLYPENKKKPCHE
jgi:hypothetical protein